MRWFFTGVVLWFGWQPTVAANYYIDPSSGDITNDGGAQNPWSTLEEVFAQNKPLQGGDTVFLRDGYHGEVSIRGENSSHVVITSEPGHSPFMKSISLSNASFWHIKAVTIFPEAAPDNDCNFLLSVNSSASNIIAEGNTLYSVADISGWTDTEWNELTCNGIQVSGSDNLVTGNIIRNIDFGISSSGDGNTVSGNLVENFSGDGLRGLGDDNVFEYNMVKNSYAVNDNHDDGFQSWSVGEEGVGTGVVSNMVLRGNTIINYTDPDQPYRGTLQGIGCFDGFFDNWRVENNVVITDHWHGITLTGATNSTIINNTVVDINEISPGPPWIRINAHKDGTPSTGNLIRNNLATDFNSDDGIGEVDHNIEVSDYSLFFADYAAFNLGLIEESEAVDAGDPSGAPEIDIRGVARPVGDGVDVGAYEYDPDNLPVQSGEKWEESPFRVMVHPVSRGIELYVPDPENYSSFLIYAADGKILHRSNKVALRNRVPRVTGTGVLIIQLLTKSINSPEKSFKYVFGAY